MRQLFFWLRYLMGTPPWDSGIVPPEIVALVEAEKCPAGRAIDLGCGPGTTAIYLAQHGWEVVGIDFIPKPIRQARAKARRAGVAGRTRFIVGDVRHLSQMDLGLLFDLAIDIGCGHVFSEDEWRYYADDLTRLVRPGGLVMLYAFRPTPDRPGGLTPEQITGHFATAFRIVQMDLGDDWAADSGSAWYRLERVG